MLGTAMALQVAPQGPAASLTLGGWGILVLGLFLVLAASGWVLYAASRLWKEPAGERPPDPADPHAPADPLETAFDAAVRSQAPSTILSRGGKVARAAGDPSGPLGPDPSGLEGRPVAGLAEASDVLLLSEALRQDGGDEGGIRELQIGLDPYGTGPRRVSARIVRPEGSQPGGAVLILSDLSGPAAVAEAATRIASRLETALSLHPDGLLVTVREDGGERILMSNRALATVLGVNPLGLEGRPISELRERLQKRFSPETASRIVAEVGTDATESFEASGEPHCVIQRTSRPLGDSRSPGGRMLSFRDLTAEEARLKDLRRAVDAAEGARESLERNHEQILLANEGLEKRISDFARFNREMKLLDEMKSNLLANVSHELQTPLVSIRGYTEMILKGRLGPLTVDQERGLQVALRNVDRLIALLDGLLAFVRTEKDSTPLSIQVFPLKPLVEEVMTLLKAGAEEKGVKVVARFPSGELSIKADRGRISQVFINLLTNAIKYNREGGDVAIEAARGHRATARVEIRDTGIGIPREDLDRVFERFYRREEGEEGGSGLGLAITKDILRMHGCMIRADSEPGKGSTFSFTLPLESKGRAERAPRLNPDRQES